ncbi:MAG: nuclear transport factor 2 family protein [Acidobacteriaceae bacterium]|nr:nuclear transport factor 2 family protein [Acidobacteriaceae bacterium]
MRKRFGMTALVLFVLGFGSASPCHINAQPTGAGHTTDLTRVLTGLEEESYRAWQSKDTKFWFTFLSDKFVSWGSSGRIDKAAAVREWSGTDCNIASYQISDSQVSRLTPEAAVITHKTTVDGSCGGNRLPNASWTATAYVLEGARWKAAFRAASAIVDPAKLPRQPVDTISAGQPASPDANTQAMLSREQAIWDAWKDRDAKRLDALMPPEIQFIDIFGNHLGTRAEALSAWSGRGCDVKSFQLADARATMFTPDFGILTLYATVDGTCFGQPVIPIWTSSFYVRRGDTWVWSFGINIPAHAGSI